MADQTMEYKVDFQAMKEKVEETGGKVGFFSQLLDPEIWDTALNAYAREGWTVVTSVNASFGDNGGGIVILGETNLIFRPIRRNSTCGVKD